MPRQKLLDIGGLDNLFNPMFCEDDDLIRRWKLLGMNCFTSLDAICYHFVSKTSRFSEEYANRTQQIELKSNRNFIRKWGTRSNAPKYDIGFVVENCDDKLVEALEPWCSNIYVDEDGDNAIRTYYIIKERKNTSFNLSQRVLPYHNEKQNEILVEIDGNRFGNEEYRHIQNLAEIIQDSGEIGEFELQNLKITINDLQTYETQMIKNGK